MPRERQVWFLYWESLMGFPGFVLIHLSLGMPHQFGMSL